LEYLLKCPDSNSDERDRFCIRAHIGNHSLFLAGVFPDRSDPSGEDAIPCLKYTSALTRELSGWRAIIVSRPVRLAPIFSTLADRFQETRLALNDVSERLFSLGDPGYSLDALLQQKN